MIVSINRLSYPSNVEGDKSKIVAERVSDMRVKCDFFGPMRELVEVKTVERDLPPETTVLELVHDLDDQYETFADRVLNENGTINNGVNVTVNGTHVRQLADGDTELEDEATVRFAPAIVGG